MKSILITGCNRGLGLGLVRTLVKQQHPPQHIFATCRNIEAAQELRGLVDSNPNVSIHLIELDIRDTDSHSGAVDYVRNTVREDGLNVLFNNAGTGGRAVRLGSTKELDILDSFRVNACAPVMLTKSFLPLLKIAATANASVAAGIDRALVLNMSSILGSIAAPSDGANYAYRMSKAALNVATKTMSADLGKLGMVCVAMHPGWVKTDMGGPKAPLSIDDAVPQMWQTVAALGAAQNGAFVDYQGERVPW